MNNLSFRKYNTQNYNIYELLERVKGLQAESCHHDFQ